MSGRIVGEILEHAPADLTPGQLLTLVALAEAAHDRDRVARNNSGTVDLSRRTRITPGGIRNILGQLAKRGLIRPLLPTRDILGGRCQQYEITRLDRHHRAARWTEDTPDDEPEEGDSSVLHIVRSRVTEE